MSAIITLENVSFSYRREDAVTVGVSGVDLEVAEGSFLVVLGRNGSGKSTLAKLLNGFLTPDEGQITVAGISTADEKRIYELRSSVGMVFQNPDNQMVATIIEDDLAFGPENMGVPPAEIRRRVDAALAAVNMTEHRDRTPYKLSGGQKQRVAIAAVLAMQPKILILDESTAMLDPKGRAEVMETAKRLNREEKMTVILITHFMDEAVDADRVIVMDKGRIVLSGTPQAVFSDTETILSAGLELPVAARTAARLTQKGMPVSCVLTDEAFAEEICRSK